MPKIIRKKGRSAERDPKLLDSIGWKILSELQLDARIPYAELGRRVGLSTSSAMERVRRLEESGIITGYRAVVHPSSVGYPVSAFILINVVGDFLSHIAKVSREMPEILECYRITGKDSFIMKVAVPSVSDLQILIDRMTPFVATTTSVVLSEIVTSRVVEPCKPPLERKQS
jgi:Lrp/AsnC family leucine-responsive transcriptional regulator